MALSLRSRYVKHTDALATVMAPMPATAVIVPLNEASHGHASVIALSCVSKRAR